MRVREGVGSGGFGSIKALLEGQFFVDCLVGEKKQEPRFVKSEEEISRLS